MFVVMGVIEFNTGGIEEMQDAVATMERETRKEEGCLVYTFSQELTSPTSLRISERWATMEALAAHLKTDHMAAFGVAVGQVGPKSMDVKLYEIAGERDLPR